MDLSGRHFDFPDLDAPAGRGRHDFCHSGPGETIKCFYPFFSRIPLGYGNLFPAASILLSAIGAAFLLFAPRVRPAILTCLGLSILANAASWMLFASFTAVSLGIVLFQAVVLSLAAFFL